MNSHTHPLAILCLLLLCTCLFSNNSYNTSMLYLTLPFCNTAEASLGGQQMEKQGNVFIAEGITPGTYLLKVSQKQRFEPSVVTNSDSYEVILYYGYITIAPKKVIVAKVDSSQHLRILGERSTKTVSITNSPCFRADACLLRDS